MKFQGFRGFPLFVFHSCRGLRRVVEEDAVDAGDLGGDAHGKAVQKGRIQVLHGNFHDVHGVDGADYAGPVEGALAVLYAGGLEVRDYGKVLPYLALKAGLGELLAKDGVGLADGLQPVAGDGAYAAHAQSGTGERLPVYHVVRKAEGLSYHADLVLV